ncbi:winged helix DNA-binding protein [Sphingobium phenoxybenzoativorans]|uniref:winged helix DNA-binding protein n=1 Tax=Sphingobium phenoxybenzoativorans TaxID=1592790 RepID=UPI0008730A8D|nr:winged helix DNA-binding protein [Sphingobium phenoxybenzoativorans]
MDSDQKHRLMTAKAWLKANTAPTQAFPTLNMFANPAWNIMLELYVAGIERRTVSIGSVSIASGAAQSTAIRYIAALTEAGLVQRLLDPHDRRKSNVWLTERGINGVERAIDAASEGDRRLGLGRLLLVENVERRL